MILAGRQVALRLSRTGRLALRHLTKGRTSLTALAVDADGVGIGAVLPEVARGRKRMPVILLKWEHVSVVGFEAETAAEPEPRVSIGFVERGR